MSFFRDKKNHLNCRVFKILSLINRTARLLSPFLGQHKKEKNGIRKLGSAFFLKRKREITPKADQPPAEKTSP
jgi:hypothetical protein